MVLYISFNSLLYHAYHSDMFRTKDGEGGDDKFCLVVGSLKYALGSSVPKSDLVERKRV